MCLFGCSEVEMGSNNERPSQSSYVKPYVSQILHPPLTVIPIVHIVYKGMESNGGAPLGNKAKGKRAMLEPITEA